MGSWKAAELSLKEPSNYFSFLGTAPQSFGVITGIVPDDAFAASSNFDERSAPQGGRAQKKQVGSFLGRALFDVTSKVLKV